MPEPATEYQWAICESTASVVEKLSSPTTFPLKEVKDGSLSFFDTENFDLHKLGIQLRHRIKTKSKFTVKVAYPFPGSEDKDFFRGKDSKCEWDEKINQKKFSCSNSAEGKTATSQQIEFLEKITTISSQKVLQTPALGPWAYTEYLFAIPNTNLELVLDSARFKNEDLVEISVRTAKPEPIFFQELQNTLLKKGIVFCNPQSGRIERAIKLRNATAQTP
jgi:hypothetical protein